MSCRSTPARVSISIESFYRPVCPSERTPFQRQRTFFDEELNPFQGSLFCRRRLPKRSCAQSWTYVPCEQGRVVTKTLGPQPQPRADVEPVIKILSEGLPRGVDVATEVPLSEHAFQVGLCGEKPAVNGSADVFAFQGFRIAADVDASTVFRPKSSPSFPRPKGRPTKEMQTRSKRKVG